MALLLHKDHNEHTIKIVFQEKRFLLLTPLPSRDLVFSLVQSLCSVVLPLGKTRKFGGRSWRVSPNRRRIWRGGG